MRGSISCVGGGAVGTATPGTFHIAGVPWSSHVGDWNATADAVLTTASRSATAAARPRARRDPRDTLLGDNCPTPIHHSRPRDVNLPVHHPGRDKWNVIQCAVFSRRT